MKSNLIPLLSLLCACAAFGPGGGASADTACPRPGDWVNPATGTPIDFQEWIGRLAQRSVVLLGESHTSAEDHRWQLQILAALHGRNRNLAIGFEAFPRRIQPVLDRWVAGALSRSQFLAESEWNDVWGFPSELYMPLFDFARMNGIPMFALNVERKLVSRVGQEGWAAVPASDREGLGDPAPASDEYIAALGRIHAQHKQADDGDAAPEEASESAEPAPPSDPDDPVFRRFVEAQLTWDRAMAEAIRNTRTSRADTTVVAIAGRGHVEYGTGILHQLRDLGVTDSAALIPWPTDRDCGEFLSASGTPVADALFAVAPDEPEDEQAAPRGPRLGVLLSVNDDGVMIDGVVEGSVAESAGLAKGDIVRQAAGRTVATPGELAAIIRRQPYGTWLPLEIEREGQRQEAIAKFPARPHPPMSGPSPHRRNKTGGVP